jgi:hypothetical protein
MDVNMLLWRGAAVAALAGCGATAAAPKDRLKAYRLRSQANEAYDAKTYAQCATLFTQAAGADGRHAGDDEYGAACCHALAGERDQAFADLDAALAHGYRDAAQLEKDDDLAPLRDDPRWKPAVARAHAAGDVYYAKANPELRAIFEEDQAARRMDYDKIDWTVVRGQDAAHRKRVDEILASGGAKAGIVLRIAC